MLAAITGATGLLGANLAALLLEQGWQVRATRRASSKAEHLRDLDIAWVQATLSEPEPLARAFEGADAVFHCAAAVSVLPRPTPAITAANVDGTQNVLDAVQAAGAGRLVHVSSAACVALSQQGELVDETAEYNFELESLDDGYSRTKRDAEALVRAAVGRGQDAVIVNPTYMFGPRDAQPSSGKIIVEVARRGIPALPSGVNNFVSVRDVVVGMLAAYHRGRSGERYLLTGENRPWADMMCRIAELAGVAPPRFRAPDWAAKLLGLGGDLMQAITGEEKTLNSTAVRWSLTQNFKFTCEKARRELDYAPGDPDEGVRAAIDWFRDAGMIPPRS